MAENQEHGFIFQDWVRRSHYPNCPPTGYGAEWDIPASHAYGANLPQEFSGLPVSVKTCKWDTAINLADALRQRSISQTFAMIVGFWVQTSSAQKNWVSIRAAIFRPADWNACWGQYDIESVRELDEIVKDTSTHYTLARNRAKEWKLARPAPEDHSIRLNQKIDSKGQRRVQCTMPFSSFWSHIRQVPIKEVPTLWSVRINPELNSPPRRRN